MYNSLLVSVLFELGVHLGSIKNRSLSTSNFFILGSRYGVDLIDVKKTIYFLQKSLFFIKEIGISNGNLLFHYTSLHLYNNFIRLYLINILVQKGNQSFFDEKWAFGQLSNFRVHAFKMVNELFSLNYNKSSSSFFGTDVKKMKSRKVSSSFSFSNENSFNYKFFDLLLRILFSTHLKYMDGIDWDSHFYVMKKYWRFILFFKFFKSFYQMPDVFLLANPNQYYAPLLESSRLKMPIISLMDTDTKPYLVSYPIFTNDDSVVLVLFYFQLFINSYLLGKVENRVFF